MSNATGEKGSGSALATERQALGRVISDFLGPGAKEFGELVADQVRLYRWRQAMRIVERAHRFAKERGIKPGVVPLSFLVPFIEQSSLSDDDETLSSFWANLLLEASGGTQTKHKLFMGLLSSITGSEAAILKAWYHNALRYHEQLRSQHLPIVYMNFLNLIKDDIRSMIEVHLEEEKDLDISASILERDQDSLRLPGKLVSFASGDQTAADFFTHEIEYTDFDIVHLKQLNLVSGENLAFRARKQNAYGVTVWLTCRAMLLSPLGFSFVGTCEGSPQPLDR